MSRISIKKVMSYILRNTRLMRGYTQQYVADQLGKTINAVSQWEMGKTSPPADDLMELCRIYGITPNQVFGMESFPELEKFVHETQELEAQIEALEKEQAKIEEKIKRLNELKNNNRKLL